MISLAITLPIEFEQPVWLWLWLLVPLLALASLRSLAGLEPERRALALIARSLLVVLLVCCLARIQRVLRNDNLTVLFLMDRSYSVENLETFQDRFIRESTADIPSQDRVGMIDFARHAYLEQLPMRGGYFLPPGRLPVMSDTDRTDAAAAMRLAMAMFPHDSAKRIVLMSDGNDNLGDLLTEARRAKADGIPVDVVPLRYRHRNEIFFDKIIAPTHAEPGEVVSIRMMAHTQKRAGATISITHNGQLVDIPPDQAHLDLQPGDTTFVVKLPVDKSGAHTFDATIRADDPSLDATPRNNTAGAFTFVSGAGRVLLISNKPENDRPLLDALRSENVKVVLKTPPQLGEFNLLKMMSYATIILSNVPAAVFTEQQQKELAIYVKDVGSGLIMLGGDEGFGAGGWIGSPIEEVMPVTFEIKHKRIIPRGALVLIMHSCELDRGNYWGKEMAKKSVDTISSQDYIGVLAYSWSPVGENWEVPLTLNTNKSAVKNKINRMKIGDMPDYDTTMKMAYRELTAGRGRDAAQKHVIILSDGDASPPSPALLNNYKKAKITVSTIGIGYGRHVLVGTLQRIARATGGKFYPARNPKQLPKIFVKESKVVRRPLIVDDPFQPQLLHAHSELLGGIGSQAVALPPLGGLVLTSAKPSPNVIVPIIRATNDGEDPVLIHWQYELGKTVAFTSGYWPVWGKNWTPWPKFAKFWAQIVRWTMRQEALANFDTYTKSEGNRGWVIIDALDKDASYLNGLQLRSTVIGPNNETIPVEFEQTGPGHYEAQFPVEQAGQYLANVRALDEKGHNMGTIRTGLSAPFSPEYRDLEPNEALLRQVAEVTSGRWLDVDPHEANVFSHDLPPTESKRAAWPWVLAWLMLPAFLLDVAVRRLANWLAFSIAVEIVVLVFLLFGLGMVYGPAWHILGAFLLAESIGWAVRFRYIGPCFDLLTHTVTALGHAGDRSAAALDQLKNTRNRVRDEMKGDAESERMAASTARRRFDVGDVQTDATTEELGDALGGAKKTAPARKTDRPTKHGPSGADDVDQATTSRLLRAKRRARRDQE